MKHSLETANYYERTIFPGIRLGGRIVKDRKTVIQLKIIENQYKGLYLGGNIRDGIGMAHRILQATELGKEV